LICAFVWLCGAANSDAGPLKLLLEAPAGQVVAGSNATVVLHVLNGSSVAAAAATLVLREAPAREVSLAPGTFQRREYELGIPRHIVGRVVLEARAPDFARVVLDVEAPPAPTERPSLFARWFREAEPLREGEEFDPGRFFREHVSAYEPLYFIAGTESPNAKFQISFKYRLLNNNGPLARHVPPLSGFHVAYSQTSLWDWEAPSAPFFDSSYRPEVLYLAENLIRGESTNWWRLNAQAGVQHESNGRGGAGSRSLNIAYLQPQLCLAKTMDCKSPCSRGCGRISAI
jgi:phospholipase A1/A2